MGIRPDRTHGNPCYKHADELEIRLNIQLFSVYQPYVAGLDIPSEIVWGMNDAMLGKGLPVMIKIFPDAPVTKTEARHFL
ncbi:MAG: hypothetical protein P8J81_04925 [Luminiphilus sp.]|nr:hypothetical protein [Luminiphilus sp.]